MLNGIQILRALAALCVVVFHSAIYLRSGEELTPFVDFFTHGFNQGVALFFVISGFVLWPMGSKISPFKFLQRRLLRIYPPFLLCCFLALTFKWALHIGDYSFLETVKALTLLPFGPLPYPLAVEWSLVYEMFFYWVLFGLCFITQDKIRKWFLLGWLFCLFTCALVIPEATVPLPNANEIALSAISFPFVLGALSRIVFESVRYKLVLPASVRGILLALSFLSLTVAYFIKEPITYFFWGLGFAIVIFVAAIYSQEKPNIFLQVLARWGDCSYGTYLIHFQAIGLFVRVMQSSGLGVNSLFVSTAIFALVVGGCFGWAEFRFHRWMTTRQAFQ